MHIHITIEDSELTKKKPIITLMVDRVEGNLVLEILEKVVIELKARKDKAQKENQDAQGTEGTHTS